MCCAVNVIYWQEIRDTFAKKKNVLTKSTFADLVTETDKNVEDLIIGYLQKKFPTHRCLVSAVLNEINLLVIIDQHCDRNLTVLTKQVL